MPRHGGDIYSFQKQEKPLLDFSANINPLGVPDVLRSAIVNVVDFLVHYPDPAQRRLRQALAEFHGKTPEQIVCGNGGADVIFRTVRAVSPSHALIPVPAFSEYAAALAEIGCRVTYWKMPFPYQLDETILKALECGSYDFLALCNPNNPTGTGIAPELLERILCLAAEKHILDRKSVV